MAKYYVESGTIRTILDSMDVDRAVLWVINEAMEATLPLGDADQLSFQTPLIPKPSHALGTQVYVSEQGFDRNDAMFVDTFEAFRHWYELFQAMNFVSAKLEKVEANVSQH